MDDMILEGNTLDFNNALTREWILSNGLGGYASSTILNCHTRKYHGLFVANLKNLQGRYVLLSKVEDSLIIDEKESNLSLHRYPLIFYPETTAELVRVTVNTCVDFMFRIDTAIVHKTVVFCRGENVLLLKYRISKAKSPHTLRIKPLIAYRGIHELSHENDYIYRNIDITKVGFSIAPYGDMPALIFACSRPVKIQDGSCWYRNFEYPEEKKRGYAFQEDLFMPAAIECTLRPDESFILCTSLSAKEDIEKMWKKESPTYSRKNLFVQKHITTAGKMMTRLSHAAELFIINEKESMPSVIAGYHWFYIWGRDTLISLPGLTFYRGRIKEGILILHAISHLRKGGLIPNFVKEEVREIAYNSIDASLWYFWCLQELLKVTENPTLMRQFIPVMTEIIRCYMEGISCVFEHNDESGLISITNPSTQMTWMDASVNGMPVTPRFGCPVEINALWFNAVSFFKELSGKLNLEICLDLNAEIEKIKKNFMKYFWCSREQCLADTCDPAAKSQDSSVRPNQILAVSLPYSPLGKKEAELVMKKVKRELLTPFGLRTLSPKDSRYRGIYEGSPEQRDSAYHQGTVWPWLLAHYGEGLLKTAENKEKAENELRDIFSAMEGHFYEAGIGYISEIFDGDYPHRPRGCIAQAWSLAELIRLWKILASRISH
ncbi:MAG: amylo-alpha-1,6-glucosidase [Syntrophales bacterium]|jgi:predicted glycogen debranching enzyme|nr:amylo-alpha-1,6-glucosidase [Syntrophales bacterium]MDY0044225.1 amylo-alpha-1,6-glucosidase [Syntrophales bacterium]